MNRRTGNIWDLGLELRGDCTIVVPTNVGWRSNGSNVMGRGIARDAARRFSWLPMQYGKACQQAIGAGSDASRPYLIFVGENKWCRSLFMVPTKPLNTEKPYLSWMRKSDLPLVKQNLQLLQSFVCKQDKLFRERYLGQQVLVPLLGCGNGELDPEEVRPLIEEALIDPIFLLVELPRLAL